jgi:hypothetical protein
VFNSISILQKQGGWTKGPIATNLRRNTISHHRNITTRNKNSRRQFSLLLHPQIGYRPTRRFRNARLLLLTTHLAEVHSVAMNPTHSESEPLIRTTSTLTAVAMSANSAVACPYTEAPRWSITTFDGLGCAVPFQVSKCQRQHEHVVKQQQQCECDLSDLCINWMQKWTGYVHWMVGWFLSKTTKCMFMYLFIYTKINSILLFPSTTYHRKNGVWLTENIVMSNFNMKCFRSGDI